MAWHSENYFGWPNSTFPIQQGIHLSLHSRYNKPQAWMDIVSRYAVTGDEWFVRLSMVPVDIAGPLRAAYGPQISDVFARAPIPQGIAIPYNQIYQEPHS